MASKSLHGSTRTTTQIATGHAGTNKVISRIIWVENGIESFFSNNNFIGKEKDPSRVVWEKMELKKEKGDKITILLRARLTGSGVEADAVLSGNEDELVYYNFSVTLTQYRNAVLLDGALTEQRFIGDLRMDAKEALQQWMDEKQDALIWTAAGTSLTRVVYASEVATATDELDATDIMDLKSIIKAKTIARKARLRPLKISGKDHFVLVMHLEQAADLQSSVGEGGWENIQKNADVRGKENSLFTGALGMYMNVILYDHESVPTADNWGAGADVTGATALMFGQGAIARAWGGYRDTSVPVRVVEQDHEDYANLYGTAISMITGVAKAVFNSEDHAVVGLRTARTALTEGV